MKLATDCAVPLVAKGLFLVLLSMGSDQPEKPVCVRTRVLMEATGATHRRVLRRWLADLERAGWAQILSPERGKIAVSLTSPGQIELAKVQQRLEAASFKGEAIAREWLIRLVVGRKYQSNARPPFLINPLSAQPLQYDIFFPPDVAFEFNGPQHYGPTEKYPDARAAAMRKTLDTLKAGLSVQHGVRLVVIVPDDLTLERMRAKIAGLLPMREIEQDDPVIQYLAKVSAAYVKRCRQEQRQGREPR